MSWFAGRKWYAAAVALVLGAIAAQFLAKYHAGQGMMAMARSAAVPLELERSRSVRVAF